MTLGEIMNAHKGYLERQYNEWRRTRWLATVIARTSGNDVNPSDLLKLPEDVSSVDRKTEIDIIKERRKWRADGRH
jgi:hypothetical protein